MVTATAQIAVLILGFGIYFALDFFDKTSTLSDTLLFVFFMFGLVTFELSIVQRVFYPIALLFSMIMKMRLDFVTNNTQIKLGSNTVAGVPFQILTFVGGFLILGFMFIIQKQQGLNIIGTPTLAISIIQSFKDSITILFAPLSAGMLGIIENKMFLSVFEVLNRFKNNIFFFLGPLSVVGALFTTALLFGFFHIVAYGLNIGAVLWASSIMLIWLGTYLLLKRDSTPMDISHLGWNGILTLGKSLQIAG